MLCQPDKYVPIHRKQAAILLLLKFQNDYHKAQATAVSLISTTSSTDGVYAMIPSKKSIFTFPHTEFNHQKALSVIFLSDSFFDTAYNISKHILHETETAPSPSSSTKHASVSAPFLSPGQNTA